MSENTKYISLNEVNSIIKDDSNSIKDTNSYIIKIDNCNGITSDLLNKLQESGIDFKFKISGELYNSISSNEEKKYSYDITQMKEIITIFEIIQESTKKLNEIGRFLYAYRLLCELFKYNDYFTSLYEDISKVEETKRSLYGTLVYGEGVCVGFAYTLHNLLSYLNIDSKMINGIGTVNEDLSGGHAWNAVKIGEKWYETDLTWDLIDPVNLPFCLKVNNEFISSHEPYPFYEETVKDLDYAENDYDINQIYNYNYIIYNNEELKFKDTLEKVKSHMKKKEYVSIEEMSVRDLAKSFFGNKYPDFLDNDSSNKTL